jgi:hypothetical protein
MEPMTLPEVDRLGIPSDSFTGDNIVGMFNPLSIYGEGKRKKKEVNDHCATMNA